VILKYNCQSK